MTFTGTLEIRDGGMISPRLLQELFRREEWNDFLDLDEVQLHLDTSLWLASAWQRDELIGYARLAGDGRIWAEISDVLVRSDYQGRGLGTELVARLVHQIRRFDPYFVQVTPIGDREARLYEKFGFCEIPCYRRMELPSGKLLRKISEVRGRR